MEAHQSTSAPQPVARRRSRKWLVLLVVVAVIVLAVVIGTYAYFGKDFALKSSEPYRMALKQVERSPKVTDRLGEPVRPAKWIPSGSMSVEGERGRANIVFPVVGPKGRADVQAQARREGGQWGIALLTLRFSDGTSTSVDVDPGGEAPKFDGGEAPKFDPNPAPPSSAGRGPDMRFEIPK